MADEATLILSPLDFEHTGTSVQVMADCGHECWISLGGIETQAKLSAKTVCMRCVKPTDVDEITVTPEIYAGLVNEVGMAEADSLIAMVKDRQMRQVLLNSYQRG